MYLSESAFGARFSSTELAALLPEDDDRAYSTAAGDGDALIDGYLGGRYAVPFAKAPALVQAIAADLIRYKLYDNAPTKEVTQRYKDAIKLLEQLRDGELILPTTAALADGAGGVQVSAVDIVMDDTVKSNYMGCL